MEEPLYEEILTAGGTNNQNSDHNMFTVSDPSSHIDLLSLTPHRIPERGWPPASPQTFLSHTTP